MEMKKFCEYCGSQCKSRQERYIQELEKTVEEYREATKELYKRLREQDLIIERCFNDLRKGCS